MIRTGSRLALAGAGLATACAVICCSAPPLVLVLPGLALLIGGAVEAFEAGLIAAIVLSVLTGAGVLVWRRRHGACSRGAGCRCGCRACVSSTADLLQAPPTLCRLPSSRCVSRAPLPPGPLRGGHFLCHGVRATAQAVENPSKVDGRGAGRESPSHHVDAPDPLRPDESGASSARIGSAPMRAGLRSDRWMTTPATGPSARIGAISASITHRHSMDRPGDASRARLPVCC